jgi:hypothetical protein
LSAHCNDCGADLVFGVGEDWQIMTCPRCELAGKLRRLKSDYLSLARWARQQNAGNPFAEQVALYAEARIAEWDLPLKDWEP